MTLDSFELITRGEIVWATYESTEGDNYSLEIIKDEYNFGTARC